MSSPLRPPPGINPDWSKEQLWEIITEERAHAERLRAALRLSDDILAVKKDTLKPGHKVTRLALEKELTRHTPDAGGWMKIDTWAIEKDSDTDIATVRKHLTYFKKLGIIDKRTVRIDLGENPVTGKKEYTTDYYVKKQAYFQQPLAYHPPEEVRKQGGARDGAGRGHIRHCQHCGSEQGDAYNTFYCHKCKQWSHEVISENRLIQDELADLDGTRALVIQEDEDADAIETIKLSPSPTPPQENREKQLEFADLKPSALEELRMYAQWVCWRYGAIEQATGKRKKIPLNPKTGGQASVSNRDTWGTYDQAQALKARARLVDGIGFVFSSSDPFIGIDLDGCIEESGENIPIVSDQAADILRNISSYTEVSPSGTGAHIIVKGNLASAIKTKEVEMYSTGRYFTFTGEQLPGTPDAIEARQSEIDALFSKISPPAAVKSSDIMSDVQPCASIATETDDQALLERALQDEFFATLMAGNTRKHHDGDWSRADLALVRKLDFYTGRDRDRIDRLFRQSLLMRPKWDEIHKHDKQRGPLTYGQITIGKICGQATPTVQTGGAA